MKLFNQRELDVLEILIHSDEPLTSTDITNARRDLTQSTAISVLRTLLKNGDVEITGAAHCGTVFARTYKISNLGRKDLLEHFSEVSRHFLDTFGLPKLVTAMLDSLDEEQRSNALSELKKMF